MTDQQQTIHQSPVERVVSYQPVQTATGVAVNLYSKATETNRYVKRVLETGEGLLKQGSAVIWPYVQPGLQRLEPTVNAQLDYLGEKAPQVQEFAAQKYNKTSARAGETVGAMQAQAGAAAEAVQARAADAKKAAADCYNTTAQTVAERATELYDNTTKAIEANVDYYLLPASAEDEKELSLVFGPG
ncbi:hypothetical protein SARC_02137 [Sphaeroforma arctica JP610]|uniref:Uncharacterized protein n=1 Tax=Sphaeroforma arctica JP610 TaxID=667725 RepID=A0A0L0GBR5_9EUKA|nr:hypothetical protein SARC_02137 [Sphaeroforma arctica JP610]KNC85688.1 hypothetical protein SARC_02137 [Sphaeroforma arctica JP610]|eukprot:XP_014159590.1 hypothetical protein SARC_02137 [Sphaeroforma arctica JP610]